MQKIIVFMVVRNVFQRKDLFSKVVLKASEISKDFFIVNHGSDDNTEDIINNLKKDNNLNLELINEKFEGTMDEMKGKYYKELNKKYGNTRTFIFLLDWDELLSDNLISEINSLDFTNDVYLINRHTFLINQVIDRNTYLPLLFESNSVEVFPFEKFHNLYKVKSKNTKKLKGTLFHYSYESIDNLLKKNIYYSKNEAIDLFEKNNKINNFFLFFRFVFEGSIYFLYSLIFHFNFLSLEGWFYSINWYVYKFYKYLFYIELKNGK